MTHWRIFWPRVQGTTLAMTYFCFVMACLTCDMTGPIQAGEPQKVFSEDFKNPQAIWGKPHESMQFENNRLKVSARARQNYILKLPITANTVVRARVSAINGGARKKVGITLVKTKLELTLLS